MSWLDRVFRLDPARFDRPRVAQPRSLVAAANIISENPEAQTPITTTWQHELWGFYDTLGEFTFVVGWKAAMASRVRLRAAKRITGADEPEIQDSGVAVDIIETLGGGQGGQAAIMSDLMTQLSVPGEGWLVGEEANDVEVWRVVSADELRRQRQTGRALSGFEILDELAPNNQQVWRPLTPNSMVVRVWRPHPRHHYLATSPARAALPTMRELDLVNRKIQAQYLSRLASAGMLVLPDEVEFPVREEFADAANPFFSELIAVAQEAIKTPGSAAATVPIPITVPAEYVDKIHHLDFTLKIDETEIEKRDSVIRRLATQLDVPPEVLVGIAHVNHWGAWAVEEQAVKIHVCPDVELITWALTVGYLWPRLQATGEPIDDWVVWYDASEIIQRPNRSANANDAYDRLEISPASYRVAQGFDDGDAPTDEEVEEMALRKLAVLPVTGFQAIDQIMGRLPLNPDVTAATGGPPSQPGEQAPTTGPPGTEGQQPPQQKAPPSKQAAQADRDAIIARLLDQAAAPHAIVFSATAATHVDHPQLCLDHLGSCPYTRVMYEGPPIVHPGSSGAYECLLDETGALVIGVRIHPKKHEYIQYQPTAGVKLEENGQTHVDVRT